MRNYKGFEGKGCILCVYRAGVFVRCCEMHKDMDEMRQEIVHLRTVVERALAFEQCSDGLLPGEVNGTSIAMGSPAALQARKLLKLALRALERYRGI